MQVICQMVGVPEEDWHAIYELSNKLVGFDDPEFQKSLEDGERAAMEMFQYAAKLADLRKNEPRDDLATALLTGEVDGEKLSDLDFNSFFMLLAVAGNETTRTATTHGARLLAEHPEQRERLLRDPSLIPVARSRRSCASARRSTTSAAPPRRTPRSAASRSRRATRSRCGTRAPTATRRCSRTPTPSTSAARRTSISPSASASTSASAPASPASSW